MKNFREMRDIYNGPIFDVHTHILPSLDDGAADMQQSIKMLQLAQDDGITSLFVTPHLVCDGTQVQLAARARKLFSELQTRSADHNIAVQLYLGFETVLSDSLIHIERLADYLMSSSAYILVEMSSSAGSSKDFDEALYTLERSGITMILAHPERSKYLSHNLNLLKELSARGVLLQVNAGSINGLWGKKVAHTAEKMISGGYIDLIGSDAHSSNVRGPYVAKALNRIITLTNPETTESIAYKKAATIFIQENSREKRIS